MGAIALLRSNIADFYIFGIFHEFSFLYILSLFETKNCLTVVIKINFRINKPIFEIKSNGTLEKIIAKNK